MLERRKAGQWEDDKYAEKIKDGWIHGWTEDDNWINYPIMYKGKLFPYAEKSLPTLCKYININSVYIAGLSVLKPNGVIREHFDDYDNSLTFHYNILCPTKGESIITIDGEKVIQKAGEALLFDAGELHSVVNSSNEHRIILFIDYR